MKPEILVYTGHYFDFTDINNNRYLIKDIAKSLSNLCRYNGHCEFYSVAQHSVLVSYLVEPVHALKALLHDASEAYTGDITAPLKQLLPDFKRIEDNIQNKIYEVFNCEEGGSDIVKQADLTALATEKKVLFPYAGEWAGLQGVKPDFFWVNFIEERRTPEEAERLFLDRFKELV